MKSPIIQIAGITAAIFIAGLQAAHAVPITIVNQSFEDNVLADGGFTSNILNGWTGVANTAYGAFNPTTAQYSGAGGNVLPSPATGANVAYINQGGAIFQSLSATWAANTTYNLSGAIGTRSDLPTGGAPVSVFLMSGSNILATSVIPVPLPGNFGSWSLNYDNTNLFLGTNIRIQLAGSSGGQANFDNIALNANPSGVPEGGATVVLLGIALFGLHALRRK